jgi:hypothetical protein
MDDASCERLTDRLEEVAGFMVTSARGLLDEPAGYGPFRLIDAARRLLAVLESEGLSSPALDRLRGRVDDWESKGLDDADVFRAYLDDLVLSLLDD